MDHFDCIHRHYQPKCPSVVLKKGLKGLSWRWLRTLICMQLFYDFQNSSSCSYMPSRCPKKGFYEIFYFLSPDFEPWLFLAAYRSLDLWLSNKDLALTSSKAKPVLKTRTYFLPERVLEVYSKIAFFPLACKPLLVSVPIDFFCRYET